MVGSLAFALSLGQLSFREDFGVLGVIDHSKSKVSETSKQALSHDRSILAKDGYIPVRGKFFDYWVSPDVLSSLSSGALRSLADALSSGGYVCMKLGDKNDKGFKFIDGLFHEMGVEGSFDAMKPEGLSGASIRLVPEFECSAQDGNKKGKVVLRPEPFVSKSSMTPMTASQVFGEKSFIGGSKGEMTFMDVKSPKMSRIEQLAEISTALQEKEKTERIELSKSLSRLIDKFGNSNSMLKDLSKGLKGELNQLPTPLADYIAKNSKSRDFPKGLSNGATLNNMQVRWILVVQPANGNGSPFGVGISHYLRGQGTGSVASPP